MSEPIVPEGQKIQEVLERITDLWTDEDRAKAEQEIREIIAQELEDKFQQIEGKTLLDYGIYIEKGEHAGVFHGILGAANMVRGRTPVTLEQWIEGIAASRRRNNRKQES